MYKILIPMFYSFREFLLQAMFIAVSVAELKKRCFVEATKMLSSPSCVLLFSDFSILLSYVSLNL